MKCKKTLRPHQEICPVTHRFSPDGSVHIDYRHNVPYQGIVIGFDYNDLLKKLILQLKYYHRYDVADFLIDRLVLAIHTNHTLQKLFHTRPVIITSIPSHRYRKYFIKGYNQSELLARGVAEKLGVIYQPLLTKRRHTHIQAFLSRRQRLTNLSGAFELLPSVSFVGNELILLVDDVTTTGSTLQTVAQTLRSISPKIQVWGAVLGRRA